MTIKNLLLALHDQLPLKKFIRNFFITGNAWGMFSKYSHIKKDGKLKQSYPTKIGAINAATLMERKYGENYSAYKCVFCDNYHIGKNKI